MTLPRLPTRSRPATGQASGVHRIRPKPQPTSLGRAKRQSQPPRTASSGEESLPSSRRLRRVLQTQTRKPPPPARGPCARPATGRPRRCRTIRPRRWHCLWRHSRETPFRPRQTPTAPTQNPARPLLQSCRRRGRCCCRRRFQRRLAALESQVRRTPPSRRPLPALQLHVCTPPSRSLCTPPDLLRLALHRSRCAARCAPAPAGELHPAEPALCLERHLRRRLLLRVPAHPPEPARDLPPAAARPEARPGTSPRRTQARLARLDPPRRRDDSPKADSSRRHVLGSLCLSSPGPTR